MTITIAPFKVNPSRNCITPRVVHEKEEHIKRNHRSTEVRPEQSRRAHEHLPITYWGIYLDDRYISYTSSKELAEKTKLWMEKWLKDLH